MKTAAGRPQGGSRRLGAFFVPLLVFVSQPTGAGEALGSRAQASSPLAFQASALLEQDLAVSLEALGRGLEAVDHYRKAIGADPFLKAPWANLSIHALASGDPGQALHLASLALLLDPQYETARRAFEQAQGALPSQEQRRALALAECRPLEPGSSSGTVPATRAGSAAGSRAAAKEAQPPADGSHARAPVEPARGAPVAASTGESPANDAGGDTGHGADEPRRACLERRAGLLAGLGEEAREPLLDLARYELEAGHAGPAAFLFTITGDLGGEDAAGLARARRSFGDPCGSMRVPGAAPEPEDEACRSLHLRRALVEERLRDELQDAAGDGREMAARRIETLLGSGLDVDGAARQWRMEARRGERPLIDLSGLTLRLGTEWFETQEGSPLRILRRRPGDAAFIAFRLATGRESAETVLDRMLVSRRPKKAPWTAAALVSTDPAVAKMCGLSLETDNGGRVDAWIWFVEAPAAQGAALVMVGFPGSGGLGREGFEQSLQELLDGLQGAVVVPPRWTLLPTLGSGEEFPVPVAGRDRTAEAGDEREAPWRTVPAKGFSLALPPGTVAALPSMAPALCAPARESAAVWFRSRFADRDGTAVAIGDDRHAGSVDVYGAKDPGEARARVLGTAGAVAPPLSDPSARLLSSLDATRALGGETGADAVSVARFRPSSGRFEWFLARLAFGARILEIGIPVMAGAQSVGLYWIPSTVRTVNGTPPSPPVDLSGRLGISFLRPPPTERRDAFYKEGDLRSRDFTMMVARGYQVSLSPDSVHAFPVRISHRGGEALARLERFGGGPAAGDPAGTSAGEAAGRIEASVRAWLDREGFTPTGDVAGKALPRPSRYGATTGMEARFTATARPAEDRPDPRTPAPARADGRAVLLQGRYGVSYLFMSLAWGPGREQREQEMVLMIGSLRLLSRTKEASSP